MELITSTELQKWGNSRESEDKLPLLLRRLIINNIGFQNIKFIDIPGGDSIWKPGADGEIITKVDSILGPAKKHYFIECGQKTDDIFVFITTCKFKNKKNIKAKVKDEVTNSDLWAEIKIFDADDIEIWLDNDLATTAWLANILGKPSQGIECFDSIWNIWCNSTIIPIDEDLILARKDIHSEEINKWFQNKSGILKIKSASRKESLLFFMASIIKSRLNKETIDSLKSQIVIVKDKSTWEWIVEYKETKS